MTFSFAEEVTPEIQDHVPDEIEQLVSAAGPYMGILVGVGIAVLIALVVTLITSLVLQQVFRRSPPVRGAISRTRLPLFIALTFMCSRLAVSFATQDAEWWWEPPLSFALLVGTAVALAWWALRAVKIVEAAILARFVGKDEPDLEDRRGRRVQTQVDLIGRILSAVIITLAVAAVLLTIPQVRVLGAGMLASAGVVSVVAGLALQSTLSNVFAGLQLAFTDSIRVGDVVVVEGDFGFVEEITLSTVVVRSWDQRRFIYPSAHFVATPFENWTRTGTQLLGTVELDVDWRVPTAELRTRTQEILENTELWDGEVGVFQLTEATGGYVQARVVLSGRTSAELFDLRCHVREQLVTHLRDEHPYALPTERMLMTTEEAIGSPPPAATPSDPAHPTTAEQEGLFTGSIAAVQRSREFSGPGEDAYRERRERGDEQ